MFHSACTKSLSHAQTIWSGQRNISISYTILSLIEKLYHTGVHIWDHLGKSLTRIYFPNACVRNRLIKQITSFQGRIIFSTQTDSTRILILVRPSSSELQRRAYSGIIFVFWGVSWRPIRYYAIWNKVNDGSHIEVDIIWPSFCRLHCQFISVYQDCSILVKISQKFR